MITSEWPTPTHPEWVPFLVREVNHLQEYGVNLDLFPFRGSMNPVSYLKVWWQVQARLHSRYYDLIHAQFGQSGLPAILPKRHPLVVTFRGSDLNGVIGVNGKITWIGWMLRRLSQLVALRADETILVSQELASSLPRKKYHIIPSGLDLELFHPIPQAKARTILNLPIDRRYVLFAGSRNNPIKRYILAETAVSLCNLDAVELLVAEGITPEKMPLYMNAADTLLVTSTREGSPNVVKEALACNLPVVSVDVGDVRERLQGIAGCVVTADDHAETIASALRQVLKTGQRVEGRTAVQHLDIRRTTQQIIDVYHQAVQHK